jgi:hypothetical protein
MVTEFARLIGDLHSPRGVSFWMMRTVVQAKCIHLLSLKNRWRGLAAAHGDLWIASASPLISVKL